MKRACMAIICLICTIPSICFANYFDDNPKQYVHFPSSAVADWYLDVYSMHSVSYDPPLYCIEINTYTVYHNKPAIIETVNSYYYNYQAQTIKNTISTIYSCDSDGNRLEELKEANVPNVIVAPYTIGYIMANVAFYREYKMWFSKEWQHQQLKSSDTATTV